ncbi:hypothetical protein FS749_014662 [Ceratobasidium sp. UAMH 11750]|nr:hypothetical protein FS749_014662 [Ceratobasidium sp. UAMH 11750]
MSLLISYVPEGHIGKPLFTEIPASESYLEVIDTACDAWRYYLPPKQWIVSCRLARQIRRAGGIPQWVVLQPQRFVDLMREHNGSSEQLELRLQIEVLNEVDDTIDPSPYDMPSRASSSIHVTHLGLYDAIDELHTPTEPWSTTMPLTPRSEYGDAISLAQRPISPPTTPTSSAFSLSTEATIMPTTFEKGVAAFLLGEYAEARAEFQKAAFEAHEADDIRHEADALRHLGTTCRHLQEYADARSHLLAARMMYEAIGPACRQEQLQCIRHLARVEADSGYQKVALVDYQELLRITAEEGFVTQHAWCSYYLGHLYNRMEYYFEARNILKDVVNVSREIQDPEIEAFATEECGYTAERQGFPQLAMECYQRALGIFKEHGVGRWVANENRVKRRMDLLSGGHPILFNIRLPKKRSIGARLFKSSHVRV